MADQPHDFADSLRPDLQAAILELVEEMGGRVAVTTLERLIEAGDVVGIVNLFEEVIGRALTFETTTSIAGIYGGLATQTMGDVLRVATLEAGFNIISARVQDRIRTEAAKLVVGIGQDSITAIRTILEQNYIAGLGARQAGRVIRSVVGLLPSHASAVGRYSEMLANQGTPPEVRSHFVETYARRLLNLRAETIARTETIAAALSGQVQGWIELANQGVLQRHRTRVVWVVTEDDRLCPWCAPMDGVEVGIGDLFISSTKGFPDGKSQLVTPGSLRMRRSNIRPDPRSQPRDAQGRFTTITKRDNRDYLDGQLVALRRPIIVAHPPLHPNCRCALSLRFID